jgi:UDP-N-acetyl-D-mannosaminuronate dehydrogenase
METLMNSRSGRESLKRPPRVLVVGAGFKRGQSWLSHSPAVALMTHLLDLETHVTFVDPLVDENAIPYVPRLDETTDWNKEGLENFDLIVVAMKQEGFDFTVPDNLDGVQVVRYCG